jgi:hypothetical protein
VERFHGRESELTGATLAHEQAQFHASGGRFVWCGTGISNCKSIQPAAQIVQDIVTQALL